MDHGQEAGPEKQDGELAAAWQTSDEHREGDFSTIKIQSFHTPTLIQKEDVVHFRARNRVDLVEPFIFQGF